jgi:hypothetical protein
MTFLPSGYKVPESVSNYMKFKEEKNKFRVLDSAITGYEWWTEDASGRHPNRTKTMEEAVDQGVDPIKHFWAFPVYNYQQKAVQILEITQKTIMNGIKELVKSEDWGDPKGYDITVGKTGEKLETVYSVMPSPVKPISQEIVDKYKEMDLDLTALYRGDDPFLKSDKMEA